MSEKDLTKSVMNKVVALEKRRSGWWLLKFILGAAGLGVTAGILLLAVWGQLEQQQAWDSLSLFQEDSEIIHQYWQDTLWVLWEELPKEQLIIGLVALGLVLLILIWGAKKLPVVWKRLRQAVLYRE